MDIKDRKKLLAIAIKCDIKENFLVGADPVCALKWRQAHGGALTVLYFLITTRFGPSLAAGAKRA